MKIIRNHNNQKTALNVQFFDLIKESSQLFFKTSCIPVRPSLN